MKPLRIDCHTHIGVDPVFYLKGDFPYAQDFRGLVEQARRNGIDRLVVFPFVTYYGWAGVKPPIALDTTDFAVPYEYENRRMMEEIYDLNADYSEVAIPFAMFDPARFQNEQVAALRKLKEKFSILGLKTQPTIIQGPIRELLTTGRALMDLAAEWDVPVLIHSSIAPNDPWSQTMDIMDVVEEWANVRFCLAHSCRFDQPSLDRAKTLSNAWIDCSAHCIHCDSVLDNLPNVAIPERLMAADYRHPEKVMRVLYDQLPNQLMWGSDAPYYSYAAKHDGLTVRLISSYEREIAALDSLSEEEKDRVLHHNILSWLGKTHV